MHCTEESAVNGNEWCSNYAVPRLHFPVKISESCCLLVLLEGIELFFYFCATFYTLLSQSGLGRACKDNFCRGDENPTFPGNNNNISRPLPSPNSDVDAHGFVEKCAQPQFAKLDFGCKPVGLRRAACVCSFG